MPQLTLNDASIYYEDKGSGTPVAFLNGVMMTTASWAYQLRDMAMRYRCILHDVRGQLKSEKAPPFTMAGHADDFAALLDHLNIPRCHVIGTSYGGEIGMIFAARYPQRVASLSVIASVSHSEPALKQQVQGWVDASFHKDTFYDVMIEANYSEAFRQRQPNFLLVSGERVLAYPDAFYEGFRGLCDAFLQMDIRPLLPRIACPTLVVAAGLDQLKVPAYSRYLADHIPNATYRCIEEAGHAVVIEQPQALNALLIDFIAQNIQREEVPS